LAGFVVDYVTVDGITRGPLSSINFKNVFADHSIEAFFKKATGGDLGKYALWESPFDFTQGDTIAHNDTLWKYQGNAGIGGWGSTMEPSVKLDYNYDPSGFGTTPWLYVGLYNGVPDTLITAKLDYKSASDGKDTLVTTTDSISGGDIFGTDIQTVILTGTAIAQTIATAATKGIVIRNNGVSFVAPMAGVFSVELFDLRGRELFRSSVKVGMNQNVATGIDRQLISRGIYLMKISGESVQTIQTIQR